MYSVESEPFEVIEGDITTLSLTAPQINVGVAMSCDESFAREFTEISVAIVSESGRSVTITGAEDTGYRYFYIAGFGKVELHCPGEESGWRSDAENFRFVGRSQKL